MGLFNDFDSYLFHEGNNYGLYNTLGAHVYNQDGVQGTWFSVWAPNAQKVSVITDTTGMDNEIPMRRGGTDSAVWECFVPGVGDGAVYRYIIKGADGQVRRKSDPVAFRGQLRPDNASVVCSLHGYEWGDGEYQSKRDNTRVLEKPMAIYEVHLGSWKKRYKYDGDVDGFINYRQLGEELAAYVRDMGYTHVELMGVCEYPFDPSWGYQVTGYYAPTARYGTPDDFRYMVDILHRNGIGVIFDWVPAHFPKDEFAMGCFDGTHLYESPDPLRQDFPIWGTYAFDHKKPEVRSFLISSAFYWINEFHVDALRVDAVAAMLDARFSREQWRPNKFGGYHNLESMDFLRQLNHEVSSRTSGYLIAEDSSTESGITAPFNEGGLGFLLKWNMGWMYDTLSYYSAPPYERQWKHGVLTHTVDYAYTENFVLVISHDDVQGGKRSLIEKPQGSLSERFGALKALFTYQFTHPGKKLLFMGQDFAQFSEWRFDQSLDWDLTNEAGNKEIMLTVKKLLEIYKCSSALHSDTKNPATFDWINRNDSGANVISFVRHNPWNYDDAVLVIISFSPDRRDNYSVGVPFSGGYERIFSTYDFVPGGGGPDEIGGNPIMTAVQQGCDGRPFRITYGLRPYEAIILKVPAKK